MTDQEASPNAVVIERILDAPVELTWRMWTDPKHFAARFGPTGATIPVAEMDVRVGGRRHVCMEMTTPAGPMQMWFTGEYLEVTENERLVYTESMSDEHGNVVAPVEVGMPADHSIATEVTVVLEDLGGRTRMVMTHLGVRRDSPGAVGWTMAFDKLSAHLDSQREP